MNKASLRETRRANISRAARADSPKPSEVHSSQRLAQMLDMELQDLTSPFGVSSCFAPIPFYPPLSPLGMEMFTLHYWISAAFNILLFLWELTLKSLHTSVWRRCNSLQQGLETLDLDIFSSAGTIKTRATLRDGINTFHITRCTRVFGGDATVYTKDILVILLQYTV